MSKKFSYLLKSSLGYISLLGVMITGSPAARADCHCICYKSDGSTVVHDFGTDPQNLKGSDSDCKDSCSSFEGFHVYYKCTPVKCSDVSANTPIQKARK